MRQLAFRAPFGVLLLFSFLTAALLAIPRPADAARSSKPKEIVVVGSKIKEVVKEAGLLSSDNLVLALSNKVRQIIAEAALRAARNQRHIISFHDLDSWSDTSYEDLLVIPEAIGRLLARGGFNGDPDFINALSDKVREVVDDGILRARANGRDTVLAHDL